MTADTSNGSNNQIETTDREGGKKQESEKFEERKIELHELIRYDKVRILPDQLDSFMEFDLSGIAVIYPSFSRVLPHFRGHKMNLQDKVCIITGGGSGIGRGAAIKMAQNGAKVVLIGRTAAKIEAVKEEIESAGGTAKAIVLDVADHAAVHQMAQDVLDELGRIDVLVNNAGHSSHHRRLLTITPEEIRSVIDSNLMGTIYCTQAVVPAMLAAKEGTIINVSSIAGVTPSPFSGLAYGAAKAAVINFTAFLNAEFQNTGIRASVVIPGEVATPILDLRPIPPSAESRATMVDVEETSAAIYLIASLPQRANIPELVIRPTMQRDLSQEVEAMP
jgi:NADP-dependent 3-hydroxy acid dehydrogenase YdfG